MIRYCINQLKKMRLLITHHSVSQLQKGVPKEVKTLLKRYKRVDHMKYLLKYRLEYKF